MWRFSSLGKSSINGLFSMAMLNNQRVHSLNTSGRNSSIGAECTNLSTNYIIYIYIYVHIIHCIYIHLMIAKSVRVAFLHEVA